MTQLPLMIGQRPEERGLIRIAKIWAGISKAAARRHVELAFAWRCE